MDRNIVVEEYRETPLQNEKLEIVERKGLGHPDTICDSILDLVSINLSKAYLEEFGKIMHHNADKSLLVAGEVETKFGGGEVKKPMLLIFGDRAVYEAEGKSIPVDDIAIQSARDWINKNLRFVDPDEHMKYQVELKPGSAALTDIFKREGKILSANDTSAAVGYAPFTDTESIVLNTEKYINSKGFKREFPESGEDVKVMGFRERDKLDLTIAMAFVDRFIESEDDYFKKKIDILEYVKEFVEEKSEFRKTTVKLNTLDEENRGIDGIYLTALGTSADGADSGQVGRGNRPNGIIPLNRHTGSEAAAGKNPVSHVGKIYNLLTDHISREIYEKVSGLEEIFVWLVSQIGQPIDKPAIAVARVIPDKATNIDEVREEIREVMNSELENIDKFCKDLALGKISIC